MQPEAVERVVLLAEEGLVRRVHGAQVEVGRVPSEAGGGGGVQETKVYIYLYLSIYIYLSRSISIYL